MNFKETLQYLFKCFYVGTFAFMKYAVPIILFCYLWFYMLENYASVAYAFVAVLLMIVIGGTILEPEEKEDKENE